ncbi:hypothetical protein F5B18DRAFT_629748 [Nemania serpens]|nr:hypothetical protein F5B18DRAFT_629748 [Nemania serpens]
MLCYAMALLWLCGDAIARLLDERAHRQQRDCDFFFPLFFSLLTDLSFCLRDRAKVEYYLPMLNIIRVCRCRYCWISYTESHPPNHPDSAVLSDE